MSSSSIATRARLAIALATLTPGAIAGPSVLCLSGCTAFLRAGHVEETAAGRKLVLPTQTGQQEASGVTKSFEPGFLRASGGAQVELAILLTPHLRAVASYLPTECDRVVVARTTTDGVSAPVRYQDHGGGRELFLATFSTSDLAPFANDGAVDIQLCDYKYRFNGSSLAPLIH